MTLEFNSANATKRNPAILDSESSDRGADPREAPCLRAGGPPGRGPHPNSWVGLGQALEL